MIHSLLKTLMLRILKNTIPIKLSQLLVPMTYLTTTGSEYPMSDINSSETHCLVRLSSAISLLAYNDWYQPKRDFWPPPENVEVRRQSHRNGKKQTEGLGNRRSSNLSKSRRSATLVLPLTVRLKSEGLNYIVQFVSWEFFGLKCNSKKY